MLKLALFGVAFAILTRFRGHNFTETWKLKFYQTNPASTPLPPTPRWRTLMDTVFDKARCVAYMGCLAGLYALSNGHGWYSLPIALIVGAGMQLSAAPGLGDYFACFDGLLKKGPEIEWIDRIGQRLVPGTTRADNLRRGLICMSLRGLYLVPLFLALALLFFVFHIGAWWMPLALAPLSLLQGPSYAVTRYLPDPGNQGVPVGELLWGGVRGLLIAAVL